MLYDKQRWDKSPALKPWQQILLDMADLIERKGWGTGGVWTTDRHTKERHDFCVVGAALNVNGSPLNKFRALRELRRHVDTGIISWNDQKAYWRGGRPYVVRTLRDAAGR